MNTGEDEKNGLMCRRGTGKRVCRYRLSAFGEFYKIYQEVLETEGTVALIVVVQETPLRDFYYKTHKVL